MTGGADKAEASQTEFAEMVGLTTRQIRNLERQGLPCRAEKNRKWYPLPEAIDWLRARDRAEAEKRATPSKIDEANLRRANADARLKELQVAREEGVLVHLDDVEAMVSEPLQQVANALRNAPSRHASALAGLAGIKLAEAIGVLAEIMEEVRSDLRGLVDDDDDPAQAA